MKENVLSNSTSLIKDFLGNVIEADCLGCAIANHSIETPGGLIYEDDRFTIQQDPLVPIKGFIIVNVKEHIQSITQMDDQDRTKLMELINSVIRCLKELNVTDKITLFQEESSKHLHFWILPHYAWMENKGDLRSICNYAKENNTSIEIDEVLEIVKQIQTKFKY